MTEVRQVLDRFEQLDATLLELCSRDLDIPGWHPERQMHGRTGSLARWTVVVPASESERERRSTDPQLDVARRNLSYDLQAEDLGIERTHRFDLGAQEHRVVELMHRSQARRSVHRASVAHRTRAARASRAGTVGPSVRRVKGGGVDDPPNDPTATSSDAERVRAVALDYIEGWYTADAERMRRSLHDDLVKRTPLGGDEVDEADLRAVSKQRMVELTSSGGGRDVADPAIEVFVDDVSDDIASARTVCADFVDYMQMVRMTDGWRIANILFRNLD